MLYVLDRSRSQLDKKRANSRYPSTNNRKMRHWSSNAEFTIAEGVDRSRLRSDKNDNGNRAPQRTESLHIDNRGSCVPLGLIPVMLLAVYVIHDRLFTSTEHALKNPRMSNCVTV